MPESKSRLNKKKYGWLTAALLAGISLAGFSACSRLQRLEKELPQGDREFIQEVRYIISKEERKAYVNIAPGERAAFRRDFWRRRDPSPDTERNEYKETYFARVAEANRLFRTEGRQGWLTERGRVYVLLGPPDHRQVYPMGYSFYEPPVEVWRYGFFPIIFVDRYHIGKYEMAMANAYYLNAVANAQIILNSPSQELADDTKKDFSMESDSREKGSAEVKLDVPYGLLLFTRKGEEYHAVLKIRAVLSDKDKGEVWEKKMQYPISVTERKLGKLRKGYSLSFRIENVPPGAYVLKVHIANQGNDEGIDKSMKIRVR